MTKEVKIGLIGIAALAMLPIRDVLFDTVGTCTDPGD